MHQLLDDERTIKISTHYLTAIVFRAYRKRIMLYSSYYYVQFVLIIF